MKERQIIALTGLRRTGKTTIMMKIIKDNISNIDKTNIVYFSFDEFQEIRLDEVIKSYSRLMNKDLRNGYYLFLFDEIQKVENWEEQLKRLYDENKNIKFIISGSESLFIRKKSKESLAGRMYEFYIKTLNFREYLKFNNKNYDNIDLYKEEILRESKNFLYSNGFPEIINKDKEISEKYIKENVIEKIIYRDIPQIFSIKDPQLLEQIFKVILLNPGQIVSLQDLAKDFQVSRQTISLYLSYLEKSFLVRKLYNYSKNARKTQKRSKKYYPSIIVQENFENTESFGKAFETFIVNELNAEFFWRDPNKNEVDIILMNPLTAIEVKSGELKSGVLIPLNKFINEFSPKEVMIISYDTERLYEKIKVIPFYKYLLGQ